MEFNEPYHLSPSNLGLAARNGNSEMIAKLLESGKKPIFKDNRGWLPVHEAAASGHLMCLNLLLSQENCGINERTFEGETALFLAAKEQNEVEILKSLIDHGAEVNITNNENSTPLHQTCTRGIFEFCELLLSANANVNFQDFDGCTPLHLAVSKSSCHLIEMLLHYGAEVNVVDHNDLSPLFTAASANNAEVVTVLIEKGAEVNARAIDDGTALIMAAQCGSLIIVEQLLNHGADPDFCTEDGIMAIHSAALSGNLDTLKVLFNVTNMNILKINLMEKNLYANNILCTACSSGSIECVEFILNCNFDPIFIHTPQEQSVGECYGRIGPISYLLTEDMIQTFGDKTYNLLEKFILEGIPVNPEEYDTMAPLSSLMMCKRNCSSVCLDFFSKCTKLLVENGANVDHSGKMLWLCIDPEKSFVFPEAFQICLKNILCKVNGDDMRKCVRILIQYSGTVSPDDIVKWVMKVYNTPHNISLDFYPLVDDMLALGLTNCELLKINQHLPSFKNDEFSCVATLKVLCRDIIRRKIKIYTVSTVGLNEVIQSLDLPNTLKNYLCYR